MTLEVRDDDFLFGLEVGTGPGDARREFLAALEKEKEFRRLVSIWALGDAEFVSKDKESDMFREEYTKFFTPALVVMATLFSANGRRFPNISREFIDRMCDETTEEVRGDENYENHLREKIHSLNHHLKRFFTGMPQYMIPTPFGVYCVYQLANILLTRIEESADDDKKRIIEEAENILKEGK